jgi:hypothetical protein
MRFTIYLGEFGDNFTVIFSIWINVLFSFRLTLIIILMKNSEADYSFEVVDGVICLGQTEACETENSNDTERLVRNIEEKGYDLMSYPVICCDVEGRWNWMQVDLQGRFTGFYSLGGIKDMLNAVKLVRVIAFI